jgi:hypothetical protein
MAVLNRLPRHLLAILTMAALLVMASCGTDEGVDKRYPVSGTVTYNGKPLEKGQIRFNSEDLENNLNADGEIKNGFYTLSTVGNDDGAQAGKYKVTVTSRDDSHIPKFRNGVPIPRSSEIAKMEMEAKSLIPAGYSDPNTTTLAAEVKEQSSNSIDFKLSDADAPPERKRMSAKGGRRGGRGS